jgi:hypothetical protein
MQRINEVFAQVNMADLGKGPVEGEAYIKQLMNRYIQMNKGLSAMAAEVAARVTYNTSYYKVTYPPELTTFVDELNRRL